MPYQVPKNLRQTDKGKDCHGDHASPRPLLPYDMGAESPANGSADPRRDCSDLSHDASHGICHGFTQGGIENCRSQPPDDGCGKRREPRRWPARCGAAGGTAASATGASKTGGWRRQPRRQPLRSAFRGRLGQCILRPRSLPPVKPRSLRRDPKCCLAVRAVYLVAQVLRILDRKPVVTVRTTDVKRSHGNPSNSPAREIVPGLIPKCGGLIRARARCRRIIGQRHFFRSWFVNAWLVGIRPPPSGLVWVEPVILHYGGVHNRRVLRPPPTQGGWGRDSLDWNDLRHSRQTK